MTYSELLIGLDRSHGDPLPIRSRKSPKFLTFDSNSTSDDESDVPKTKSFFKKLQFNITDIISIRS